MSSKFNPLLIKVVHPPYGAKHTDSSNKKQKDNEKKGKPKPKKR